MKVLRRKMKALFIIAVFSVVSTCTIVSFLRVDSIHQITGKLQYSFPQPPGVKANHHGHHQQLPVFNHAVYNVHKHQMPADNDDGKLDFPDNAEPASQRYDAPLSVPRVAEYCNIPKAVVLGDEGEAPKDYKLVSVFTLIRHGDRTPMKSYVGVPLPLPPNGCMVTPKVLQDFPELHNFLQDLDAQKDQQPPKSEFHAWSLYPKMPQCGSSHLTAVGALQHLLNGLALKEKYVNKWNLFGDRFSPDKQLDLQSTQLSRTYQSAVAFLYTFLPHFNVSALDIQASHNTVFCSPSYVPHACCDSLGKLKQEAEKRGPKKNANNPLRAVAYAPIADVFGLKPGKLPWPSALMDLFQGHACHDLPLPCGKEGKCVTGDMLETLWQLVDSDSAQLLKDPKIEAYHRTITHSMLSEIYSNMERAAKNRNPVKFTLYSGHDITVTPMLDALGVHDGKWPPYASRVVLELYRKVSVNVKASSIADHYIRMLYNGKDVTSRVRFCQGRTVDGMCALKHFQQFVWKDNLDAIGAHDRKGLQGLCAMKSFLDPN